MSTVAGSFVIMASFPADPFPDVGRAMEQLGALPLALPKEVDDIDADHGDSLQIEGGAGTTGFQFVRDLPEMLGLHEPDQADRRPGPIPAALDLERHHRRLSPITCARSGLESSATCAPLACQWGTPGPC